VKEVLHDEIVEKLDKAAAERLKSCMMKRPLPDRRRLSGLGRALPSSKQVIVTCRTPKQPAAAGRQLKENGKLLIFFTMGERYQTVFHCSRSRKANSRAKLIPTLFPCR